jgi:hypothetical protein
MNSEYGNPIEERSGSPEGSATQDQGQKIVEAIIGKVTWHSDTEGFCECPGRRFHTTHNGKRDCKVYLDSVATLSCFHGSCREMVREVNDRLRKALRGAAGVGQRKLTPEEKARIREIERLEGLRRRVSHARGQILAQNQWKFEDIQKSSPTEIHADCAGHWRLILERFEPGDVVWIGDKFDSGQPRHQSHFKSVEDWLGDSIPRAQFICPSSFKSGSHSRSNANVVARRFLVVESDELTKDEVGAVFKWLRDKVELKLEAIVDTAGKSLHAWFAYPDEEVIKELKVALPELGCDPKLFTASQPVRLPGALRDGKHQRLVYLGERRAAS